MKIKKSYLTLNVQKKNSIERQEFKLSTKKNLNWNKNTKQMGNGMIWSLLELTGKYNYFAPSYELLLFSNININVLYKLPTVTSCS